MVDAHLINIAELGMLDVVTLDRGETKWVKYEQSIDLNDYEKVHSGGSSDSYTLRSISDPSGARISSNHCSTSALMNCCALPARWWLE
jgi:hypothetical protein